MAGIVWSKRLAKLIAVALLVAVTCIALGIWQIARLHQKQQFNAAVRAGLAEQPAPVEAVLPDGVDPDTVRYRRVEATGTYDTDHGFVLYGRTQDSQAGNHLLTPLLLTDGHAILVDRGWVPLDVDEPGAPEAAPPSGEVAVEGVLFSSEGDPPGAVDTGGPARDDALERRPEGDPGAAPLPHRTQLRPAPTTDPGAARWAPGALAPARAVRRSAPQLRDPVVHVRRDRGGRARRPRAPRGPGSSRNGRRRRGIGSRAGRDAVGCLMVLFALVTPRFIMVVLWIFTDYLPTRSDRGSGPRSGSSSCRRPRWATRWPRTSSTASKGGASSW